MKPIEKSVYDYLKEYAEEKPNDLLFWDDDRTYTVLDIYNELVAIANDMYAFGVRTGDKVAVRATRTLDTTVYFFAIHSMGAALLPCDEHATPEKYLNDIGINLQPDFVIENDEDEAGNLLANWTIRNCKTNEKANINLAYPARKQEVKFDVVSDMHSLAMIIFTSGSTGKSKGVMLSHYNYINHIRHYATVGALYGNDNSIQLLPLHHVFGIMSILDAIYERCPIYFVKSLDVDLVLQSIEKYRVTRFAFVPSYALMMANVKNAKGYDTSSMKVVILAGAPSTREQFQYIETSLGAKIVPVYGQSECIGITGCGPWEDENQRASSVGKLLPMNEGFILDEHGNELPAGQEGEICVKGPAVMMGYYGDDYSPIDEQGRLHTGDVGYFDAEGFLRITGRIKDIIIINGNNVSAGRLENKLMELPFVFNAAVVGIKDEKRGEAPLALIVLKEGATYDEEAVKAVFNKAEMPKRIEVVKEFPLTSSGKIDKQKIKELYK